MMTEIPNVRQVEGEDRRRWFSDGGFDLIVWYGGGRITAFQLCYKDGFDEKALTWLHGRGFFHNRVDDGEGRPARHKMTPILVADGLLARDHVSALFQDAARDIDPEVVQFVVNAMKRYPEGDTDGPTPIEPVPSRRSAP